MKMALIAFCLILYLAGHAYADTDYVCLKQCVEQGGSATSCMTSCTYGATSPLVQPSSPKSKSGAHSVFNRLIPIEKDTIVTSKTRTASPVSKDYVCFNQCLQQHNAYGTCEKKCIRNPDKGAAGGAVVPH